MGPDLNVMLIQKILKQAAAELWQAPLRLRSIHTASETNMGMNFVSGAKIGTFLLHILPERDLGLLPSSASTSTITIVES